MGDEVRMGNYANDEDKNGVVVEDEGVEERVTEWEKGLPSADDLAPLCLALIPPELASAFSISPEPQKTLLEVTRACQSTLRCGTTVQLDDSFDEDLVGEDDEEGAAAAEEDDRGNNKRRKMDSGESEAAADGAGGKRARLVWTPQLHKRFVDVVAHLGIKNAVPKTIMQMMNVEGLTRENVASHLQKYRLYLKRMQGGGDHTDSATKQSNNGNNSASASSSPLPPVEGDVGNGGVPYHQHPVPFHHHPGGCHGRMMMPMPMPMYGHMGNHNGNSSNHHHPHYHHPPQLHQFAIYNSSSNQNGFDGSFGYNYSHHPHCVAPSGDT